jgi:hypothetical protein
MHPIKNLGFAHSVTVSVFWYDLILIGASSNSTKLPLPLLPTFCQRKINKLMGYFGNPQRVRAFMLSRACTLYRRLVGRLPHPSSAAMIIASHPRPSKKVPFGKRNVRHGKVYEIYIYKYSIHYPCFNKNNEKKNRQQQRYVLVPNEMKYAKSASSIVSVPPLV